MGFFKNLFGSCKTCGALPAETGKPTSPIDGHLEIHPIKTKEQVEEERWEQRRWELVRYLVAQDRRSVVLGKLQASPKTIASKARELADATINELRTNQRNFNNGRKTDNQQNTEGA